MTLLKTIIHYALYQPLYNFLILLVWLIPGHFLGLAIILLTVIIRFILWPTASKGIVMQKKMRTIQPQLAELKEKYKGDQKAQSAALMELYKEHNINPIGSCLPLLIQLPVFFVLYRVFINGIQASNSTILYSFVPHTVTVNTMLFGIDLTKPDRWVLPIIAGAAQFWQSKQLMPKPTNLSSDKTSKQDDINMAVSKQMTYFMPVILIVFARNLPAALPLYWAANSLFAVFQQWYLMERKTEEILEKADKIDYSSKKDITVTIRKKHDKK